MKNLGLYLIGAAAVGGLYFYLKSKKEEELSDDGDREIIDALAEQVEENKTNIGSNSERITDTEGGIESLSQGVVDVTDLDLSGFYTKNEVDGALSAKANTEDVYDKTFMDVRHNDLVNNYESYADTKLSEAETYADDAIGVAKDGIEADIANDFYSKTDIDDGFATIEYTDSAEQNAKDYADVEDATLEGELQSYATTAASSVGTSVLNSAQGYADTKVDDLETTIDDNYAQLTDLPIMSDYATLEYVNTGLEGKQAAGSYATQEDLDAFETEVEANYFPKDVGNALGALLIDNFDETLYDSVVNPVASSAEFNGSRFRKRRWS